MKREERLNFIAQLIKEHEIKTQDELVQALLAKDVDVTQATISRDIQSLALIKIPAQTGGYRYDLPTNTGADAADFSHQSLAFEAVVTVKQKENLLALRVAPGTSSLLKSQLLQVYEAEIFSIIVDDDSLLVIFETAELAKIAYRVLTE